MPRRRILDRIARLTSARSIAARIFTCAESAQSHCQVGNLALAARTIIVVVVAGLLSMGWMAAVNFILDSDFKWVLLSFALLWPIALVLVLVESDRARASRIG